VVTPKTAANHVEHIYAKLGVSNRAAATLYATQHGPLVTGISRGCARDIHLSSIARTSPLRMGGLSRRQGLIVRLLTTMR
jgi:hypothetical protein